ncbi:MAG: PAS domain-containing protein [Methanomicrobiales archaeon]|nr:PAS domain-containing protein [Methanomicrobiales archaeon]
MSEKESELSRIIAILRDYPKGLTIDEVSRLLSISRPTAAKYLNNMLVAGQAELRELGRAKLFYLSQRLPLTNLLSLASDLILILDAELFIREVNEPFLEAFSLQREDIRGTRIEHSLLAPYVSDEHLAAIKQALEGQTATFEMVVRPGDAARYFRMKVIPLVFEDQSHGAGVLLEDITAMKEYQQQLEEEVRFRTAALVKTNDALQKEIEERRKAGEALARNEARLKRAEGVAHFGNWEYHRDSKTVILSEGAQALYGVSGREFPVAQIFSLILEEYHPLIRQATRDLVEDNRPYDIEYKIRRPTDGAVLSINSLAEYDRKSGIIFGVNHDISQYKRADEAVQRATKQIMLLNSVTRHDILNQLTILSSYIGLSKKMTGDEKHLQLIGQEEQVADTIRRQIVFTRDYQTIGLQPPQWTNVEEMVTKALATTDKDGASLVIKTGTLELFTDLLIEKVYANLVDNSLRHGNRVTTITFRYQQKEQGLTLIYEDDGIGIPEEEKEQIFERGFGKNTGYGLFLVREILSITGFSIRECGEPGKGVRFEIRVPDGAWRVPADH